MKPVQRVGWVERSDTHHWWVERSDTHHWWVERSEQHVVSEMVSKSRNVVVLLVVTTTKQYVSNGAGCPNRTDDLPLTRRVLYQLS